MTTTDQIKLLLELGEADRGEDWPDYLHYGFVVTDVPALLDMAKVLRSINLWGPLAAADAALTEDCIQVKRTERELGSSRESTANLLYK